MQIQKMALVPLEIWEEYEAVALSVKEILDRECRMLEDTYSNEILNLRAQIELLKAQLKAPREGDITNSVIH